MLIPINSGQVVPILYNSPDFVELLKNFNKGFTSSEALIGKGDNCSRAGMPRAVGGRWQQVCSTFNYFSRLFQYWGVIFYFFDSYISPPTRLNFSTNADIF